MQVIAITVGMPYKDFQIFGTIFVFPEGILKITLNKVLRLRDCGN